MRYLEKSISTISFQLFKECTTKTCKKDKSTLGNEKVLPMVTSKILSCAIMRGHFACLKSISAKLQLDQNSTAIHLSNRMLASILRVKQQLEETPTLLFLQD